MRDLSRRTGLSVLLKRHVVRNTRHILISITLSVLCARLCAQDILDTPPPDIAPSTTPLANAAPLSAADNANLEGCQVIARVDDQIVLACDVLWRVNQMLEEHQKKVPANQQVPEEQLK